METLQAQLEETRAAADRLDKSRKKLQAEVDDCNMELEKQRSSVLNAEKKQRKFDSLLAEEKASTERYDTLSDDHGYFTIPLAPHCCVFESHQGLWIISCKEAIQLACRTLVVLLRCLLVLEICTEGHLR